MILSEQCCLKWQSDKLAELGVTAESECLHREYAGKVHVLHVWDFTQEWNFDATTVGQAYTVAELARPVAAWMDTLKDEIPDSILDKYGVDGANLFSVMFNPKFLADTLIHLLENNLITASQVNEAINKPQHG